jgi:DHA2 family multidrug resistance protein-like MFS transporter
VLGLSPLEAGAWMLPSAAGFVVSSMLAPLLVRRLHPGNVTAAGLALAAAGFALLARLDGSSGLADLVAGSTVMALGLGPVFTLAADLVVSTAPPERAGAASAILETSSEFGSAAGIAILGSVGLAIYRDEMNAAPAGAGETLAGAVEAAGELPAGVLDAANVAFAHGLQVVALASAAIMVAMALLSLHRLRAVRIESAAAAPAGS